MTGRATLSMAIVAVTLITSGCRHARSQQAAQETVPGQAAVHVETGDRDIAVGQTAILSARTENTFERDAKITWKTTGGTLEKEEIGDVVRVTFNKPGTYRVTARLKVQGESTHQDSIDIHVH